MTLFSNRISIHRYICAALIALVCASSIGSIRAIKDNEKSWMDELDELKKKSDIQKDKKLLLEEEMKKRALEHIKNSSFFNNILNSDELTLIPNPDEFALHYLNKGMGLDPAAGLSPEDTKLIRYIQSSLGWPHSDRSFIYLGLLLGIGSTGGMDLLSGGKLSAFLSMGGTFFDSLFTYMQLFSKPGETFSRKPVLSTISSLLMAYVGYKSGHVINALTLLGSREDLMKRMVDTKVKMKYQFPEDK